MAAVPGQARVVVIGGGAVGASCLYHLARAGWTDALLLEKNELTAGSTWHAAGNVPTFSSSWSIMNMQRYSAELYRGLGAAVEYPMNYHVTGSVRLAHSRERLQEFQRVVGMGRYQGMDLDLLAPGEIRSKYPFLETHDLTGALYDRHVLPYLGALGFAPGDITPTVDRGGDPNLAPTMNVRVFDAGPRADNYRTDTIHLAFGAEGSISNIDYTASYVHSENRFKDEALSGYMSKNFFDSVIANGTYDPLANTAGQSAAVLDPGVLRQTLDESKSTLDLVNLRGSTSIGTLAGGDIGLGFGGEFGRQTYSDTPSAILQGTNKLQPGFTDAIIGGGGGALPFDSKRDQAGIFGEVVLPVLKTLEVTGALR